MKSKLWLAGWFTLVTIVLGILGLWVYKVDPYFHYHKPSTEEYYYSLNNQRSQNNGISKYFDYDALITGTSMTENFKTSEFDEIFGVNSIKVSFEGGSYKEMNDNLIVAITNNDRLKTVVRGLDMGMFFDSASRMREDLGTYPTYLYDSNPLNDVNYLFNRDVIFGRVYPMTVAKNAKGYTPGITSFDEYSRWQDWYTFGVDTVCPNEVEYNGLGNAVHLTVEDKSIITENINQNVTSLADEYPNVDFYYFFTPYSIASWGKLASSGTIYRQIEAEKYIIELILEHENIHLYSFNNRTDIIKNLNNYKDAEHYGQWINSLMLKWMKEGECLLTKDNFQDYLSEELKFYTEYDYNSIHNQVDYESDFYAAALLNEEFVGASPLEILSFDKEQLNLMNAKVVENEEDGSLELKCTGALQLDNESDQVLESYLINEKYIGAKVEIDDIGNHKYLTFYGKKTSDYGQPSVFVYNNKNEKVAEITANFSDVDNEWHQYVLDLTKVNGKVTVILNGGAIDKKGKMDSIYVFKNIMLY